MLWDSRGGAFGPGSGVGVQGRLPGEKKKLSMVLKDKLEQGEGLRECSGRGDRAGIAWRRDIAP